MAAKTPKPQELLNIDHRPPHEWWMDKKVVFKPGTWCYSGKPANVKALDLPFPREWSPDEEDWHLPDNWKEIVLKAFRDRLHKFRSLKVFMDICVRCGACADKCHFFIGSGDPKNMPVLRAELLRSVYRGEFTTAGKILGRLAGGRKLTYDVIKEWFYYFFQCTECRRCSVFCPYGIDTAEVTMLARELLLEIGLNINWIMGPVSNSFRTGNHMGLLPHTFKDNIEFLCEDIEDVTGIKIEPTFNRKGAEILFITPSADVFAEPGIYTAMGYMLLFHYLDLDYTWSTYASEGGNFGIFTSHEMMKRLNAKMYAEAKRLGVKWILGGECGHMWRVVHQYMATLNGPADFLEVPVSPITGTRFEHAKSTKMIHILEFVSDLIKNKKLNLDPSRNDHLIVTHHDSCNPVRGMGMIREPRYVIQNSCNNFYDMPENTIFAETFCCGSGAGLNTDEYMEMRMRGGLPRANAVDYVNKRYGVNRMTAICAIDRAVLPTLMNYWVPDVSISGISELLGNALVMPGEKPRDIDLRQEPLVRPTAEMPSEEEQSDV